MQLVGHYLVLYATPGEAVGESVLGEALHSARSEFQNDVCSTTLEALSAKDVEYLVAMVRIGCPCRSAEVARRLGVTPDYAQQYRRRLLQAGVILAPAHGLLDFAVPYLADYLRGEFDD